jgi:large subunit ribosomal protein L30
MSHNALLVEFVMGKLAIKQVRSAIRRKYDQQQTLVALGIKKMGGSVVHEDTPQIRGMIKKVIHLVEVSEIQ